IGMSEEADQGRRGAEAVSTFGMTAEEVEELERGAGAPEKDEEERAPADKTESDPPRIVWIPEVKGSEEEEVPLGDLFGRRHQGDGHRPATEKRSQGR
ncbi:MAG: hypothetical protein ACRDHO_05745, partial [Actinomycetota bacterium]